MAKSKVPDITEVVTSDLKALLFWATIGITGSTGGSYQEIEYIIESYAEYIRYALPYKPIFASRVKPKRKWRR